MNYSYLGYCRCVVSSSHIENKFRCEQSEYEKKLSDLIESNCLDGSQEIYQQSMTTNQANNPK